MKLVSLKQLRDLYNLSRYEGNQLIKKGLPCYRPGRNYKVDLDEFEEWFQQFKCVQGQIANMETDDIFNSSLAEAGIN